MKNPTSLMILIQWLVSNWIHLYFPDRFLNCDVAGSINGIICLFSVTRSQTRFVVLWNPTINYWKIICLPIHKDEDYRYASIGLTFDSLTNDYKIIRLVYGYEIRIVSRYMNRTSRASHIEVYSAKQDSWSVVDSQIPFLPHTGSCKKIPYPQIALNQETSVHPFNLMDSLALLIYSPGDQTFHVYALDDDATTTWINKYSTPTPTILQNKDIFIVQCFEDAGNTMVVGRKHYHYQQNYFLYDLKTDRLIYSIGLDAFQPRWDESYHHVENLVFIPGMELIQTEDA